MEYGTYIQHLKDDLPAHQRCHCVFSTDCVLYRCTDCATGESSCLCAECFESGNHEVLVLVIQFHIGTSFQKIY